MEHANVWIKPKQQTPDVGVHLLNSFKTALAGVQIPPKRFQQTVFVTLENNSLIDKARLVSVSTKQNKSQKAANAQNPSNTLPAALLSVVVQILRKKSKLDVYVVWESL